MWRSCGLTYRKDATHVPTCQRLFSLDNLDEGLLTDEHAPPKGLGGTIVALTCKECNSVAGHTYDVHAINREYGLRFATGRSMPPLGSTINQGGITVNVATGVTDDGTVQIIGRPGSNSPGFQSEWEDILAQLADGGDLGRRFTIALNGATFDNRSALISYLRSAYIIAFACFGYRFIFSPALLEVRRQLAEPGRDIIPTYSVLSAEEHENQVMVVHEPSDLQSLLVVMGSHLVFLPLPGSENDIYRTISRQRESDAKVLETVRGTRIAWPNSPRHELDKRVIDEALVP